MRTVVAILLIIITLAFGVCAWMFYFDTPFLLVVQPGVLYRDGFTGIRRFENAYRRRPFKTVISLVTDEPNVSREELTAARAFCKEKKIAFYSIPTRLKSQPTSDEIKQFLSIVGNPEVQPVLMIDGNGIQKVGLFAAIWQKEGMGYPYEKTLAAIHIFDSPDATELIDYIKRLYHKQ